MQFAMNANSWLDSTFVVGVVPIFVNTGAALLPAILAGVASVLGLLLRPRELFRLCVHKPWVPVLVIAVSTSGYFLAPRLVDMATTTAADSRERRDTQADVDWAAVARELIEQEQRNWRKSWLEERERRVDWEQRVEVLQQQVDAATDEPGTTDTTRQDVR